MKRKLLFWIVLFIVVSSSAIGENLLWITRSLSDGDFVYVLFSYDLNNGDLHTYDLEMEQPCIIQGGKVDSAYIADYNYHYTGADRIDIYEWTNNNGYRFVDSYSVDDADGHVIAYKDGWLYAKTEENIVRMHQGTVQNLAAVPEDSYDQALFKPAFSNEGNLAFWDSDGGYDGIRIIYPEGQTHHNGFIRVYSSNYVDNHDAGLYFTPAPPLVWLDDTHIICFAIRMKPDDLHEKIEYYTDALVIDIEQGSWSSYEDENGKPISFQEYQINGYACIDSAQKHLYLIYGGALGEHWTLFEYNPHQIGVGEISLKKGNIRSIASFSRNSETMEEYSILTIVD
ncbi:MAG: hypothetical protein Q4A54_12285 [Parabacteroides sp.]|nr:hypothetical protein [Parabacteroides sp.]